VPVPDRVEFFVEDETGLVAFGLQFLVEWVDQVVRVAVDDADEGSAARVVSWQHHVVVNFACFSLDFDLQNALELNVSFGKTVFG
jgi:hypothetical protein